MTSFLYPFRHAWLLMGALLAPWIAGAAESDWLANEVLTQLQELRVENAKLRRDLEALRSDLGVLREAVASVQRSGTSAAEAPAPLEAIDLTGRPQIGAPEANVVILEFTDFECPYCRRHHQRTAPLIKQFYVDTGRARYAVAHFPLNFHPQAKGAAVAAHCAATQGKFWEIYGRLFDGGPLLGPKLYGQLALELALDTEAFDRCIADPESVAAVDRDLALGERAGVNGTPAFLIGRIEDGRMTGAELIVGAQPYSAFAAALDRKSSSADP